MNTLIVGAGRMGRAAGAYLKNQNVDVMFADKNWQALDAAAEMGYGIVPIRDNTDWAAELNGVDVVLSAADYSLNGELTWAAIQSKTHMCDLGGNNDVVDTQLSLHESAVKAGITVVPDCGLAPGLTGWLAAHAVEQLREYVGNNAIVDNVKIRVGGLSAAPIPPINYSVNWSVRGLINEYIEPSKIVLKGERVMVESLTGLEEIDLEHLDRAHVEKYGPLEAFYTSGGISTLPDSLIGKVQNMDYKTIRYAGHCDIMKGFKQIGLFSEDAEHAIIPRTFTEHLLQKNLASLQSDMVLVKVSAELNKDMIEYELVEYADTDNTGHSAMARTTAYSAAIVAQMLGEGTISDKGVIPGEKCVPMDNLIERLEKTGVEIKETANTLR